LFLFFFCCLIGRLLNCLRGGGGMSNSVVKKIASVRGQLRECIKREDEQAVCRECRNFVQYFFNADQQMNVPMAYIHICVLDDLMCAAITTHHPTLLKTMLDELRPFLVKKDNEDVCSLLLPASVQTNVMQFAIRCNNFVAFEQLIEYGYDLNIGSDDIILRTAVHNRMLEIVEYIIGKGGRVCPKENEKIHIIQTCFARQHDNGQFYKETQIAECLLRHGADINSNHCHGMAVAAESGHLNIVKWYVEHGARTNPWGGNPLRYAIRFCDLPLIDYLIEHGALELCDDDGSSCKNSFDTTDKNVKSYKNPCVYYQELVRECIHSVVRYSGGVQPLEETRLLVLQKLVEHPIFNRRTGVLLDDDDQQTVNKNTSLNMITKEQLLFGNKNYALLSACSMGLLLFVKYLVKQGANIHCRQNRPFRNAVSKKQVHVIEYLLQQQQQQQRQHPTRNAIKSIAKHRPWLRTYVLEYEYKCVVSVAKVLLLHWLEQQYTLEHPIDDRMSASQACDIECDTTNKEQQHDRGNDTISLDNAFALVTLRDIVARSTSVLLLQT